MAHGTFIEKRKGHGEHEGDIDEENIERGKWDEEKRTGRWKKNAQTKYKMGIKITRYTVGGYVAIQPESKKEKEKAAG